jgi:phosphate transport system permease protein
MATIELQTSTELAESRRKMQAKRRLKNRIALTPVNGTMASGCSGLSGS